MQDRLFLNDARIALSISDSPDLLSRGLGKAHLRDVAVEIARYLMSAGAHLLYGGDLRTQGYTEVLCEIAARHHKLNPDNTVSFTNYLAWPTYADWGEDEFSALFKATGRHAEFIFLSPSGAGINILADRTDWPRNWALGLSSMRRVMTSDSDARISLGGAISGYKGRIPGVAEEVSLALEASKPVFLVGGFGGCSRDIAQELNLTEADPVERNWEGRNLFRGLTYRQLNNGLAQSENRRLAETPHTDEIVALILRGFHRLSLGIAAD
ncbi:MAG: hypothetical protein RO009_23555 [Pseudorhodoplanes sp.]|jgi:hypothetical protein|nr:hypothetical protein [Pseudorhodoplanes sp.]